MEIIKKTNAGSDKLPLHDGTDLSFVNLQPFLILGNLALKEEG